MIQNTNQLNKVQLSIEDEQGNTIAVLFDKIVPDGNYTINWNAEKLSSGIYYCRLNSNENVIVKQMMLLK